MYRIGYTTNEVIPEIAYARMYESICNVLQALDTDDYNVYLTSQEKEKNFRFSIYPEYKAGRSSEKPVHYQALRDYLVGAHKAVVWEGEADDALGINQTKDTCIVSIDKDLDQIEGWHYNFVKGIKYYIEPLEGLRNYYSQILQGDRIDNIQGLKGVGPKTAAKLLKDCKTEQEMEDVITQQYRDRLGETFPNLLERNKQLLKIHRELPC